MQAYRQIYSAQWHMVIWMTLAHLQWCPPQAQFKPFHQVKERSLCRTWVMQDTGCLSQTGNTFVTPVFWFKSWADVYIQAAPLSSTCQCGSVLSVHLWVISASAFIPFGIWFKDSHIRSDPSFKSLLMCLWQLSVLQLCLLKENIKCKYDWEMEPFSVWHTVHSIASSVHSKLSNSPSMSTTIFL